MLLVIPFTVCAMPMACMLKFIVAQIVCHKHLDQHVFILSSVLECLLITFNILT